MMKVRRLIGVLTAFVMIFATTITAFAWTAQYSWTETYDGGKKLHSTFVANEFSSYLNNVQPGDTLTLTATIENTSDQSTSWYLSNTVLQDLESGGGTDGAYYYVLTYDDGSGKILDIFNSKTVGGANGNGLSDATQALGDWVYIGALDKNGGSGTVNLSITFEGDTINNAYMNSLANVELAFAVEEDAAAVPADGNKLQHLIHTQMVKTGDAGQLLLYSVIVGVGIIVLMFWFLKRNKDKQEEVA